MDRAGRSAGRAGLPPGRSVTPVCRPPAHRGRQRCRISGPFAHDSCTRRPRRRTPPRGSPGVRPRRGAVSRRPAPAPSRRGTPPWLPRLTMLRGAIAAQQAAEDQSRRRSPCPPSGRRASSSSATCPAIYCACSRVPPFDRYATVIPVARNVWQHVEGGSPAAAARRLIIARTTRRSSARRVSCRPAGSTVWESAAFGSSSSAAST